MAEYTDGYYLVTARLRAERRDELASRLQRGEFRPLQPFGKEVNACLTDARVLANGRICGRRRTIAGRRSPRSVRLFSTPTSRGLASRW
jgi:hypothetical protein